MAAQAHLKLGEVAAESGILLESSYVLLLMSNIVFSKTQTYIPSAWFSTIGLLIVPGNYPQAVDDFQECLALQKKHLPPDSRLVAETHCQLGLNFTLTDQYSQAIEQFNSSIAVINSRLGEDLPFSSSKNKPQHWRTNGS